MSTVFNDRDIDFDKNMLTNLDIIIVIRHPTSVNELSKWKYVDDSIGEGSDETQQNIIEVSVGKNVSNLTKSDREQILDTKNFETANAGGQLLPLWRKDCNDMNNAGKTPIFPRATGTNSPIRKSRSPRIPPIGVSFSYIETSGTKCGSNSFVSFE